MLLAASRLPIACALALLASPHALRAECRAWPGEPEPLPQLGTSDALMEHWVRARREELRGLALLLEASDPLEARRLWLHAACLAPGDSEIAAALSRTALPVVHRVAVDPAPARLAARRATLAAALADLDAPVRIAPPEPPDPEVARFDFSALDAQIAAAVAYLDQARFQSAAELADLSRARLVRLAAATPVRERRARIEVVAATARIALGDVDDARRCVERALAARPDLVLDSAQAPPKLQRLFEEARAGLEESAQ
jgi:hypothetical protein